MTWGVDAPFGAVETWPGAAWAGIKGYITNLRACPDGTPVTADFLIGAYHQLLQIENRLQNGHDLQARPVYHRKRD
jgi:hypothetical protein